MITVRVGRKQKSEWAEKARRSGMSLTLYISYVMDRTDLVVSLRTRDNGTTLPPRR